MESLRCLSVNFSPPPPLTPSLTPSLKPYNNNSNKPTTTTVSATSNGAAATNTTTTKWAHRLLAEFQFLPNNNNPSEPTTASLSLQPPPVPSDRRHVAIPLDFYRILGAETHFLGDGIRRAYEARVSKTPPFGYGYSDLVLIARREILQAACETLENASSRREYNQGLEQDDYDTILTEVPWDKVPGALCVLQEAGETDMVLQIGESLLKERLPKSFKQDIILAMSLAYVDMSRDAMAFSPPDFIKGCDSLERALKLLEEEGASSLAPDLKNQIDETIEEITPRCVLELIALPLDDVFRTKRKEGLQGVINILSVVGGGGATSVAGGFTREGFMNEALLRMTAAEQVDLFVATPKYIHPESFEVYNVALALVAQAFVSKQPHLIKDADNLFQQLQQTKIAYTANPLYTNPINSKSVEFDFALERGLCSLLIGELDDCRTWLGLDTENSPYRNISIVNFVIEHGENDKDNDFLPGLCKLLETWLMEVVFPKFRDTSDFYFRLGDYYDDPKVLRYLESLEGENGSPLAAAAAIVKIGEKATAVLDSVKDSAIHVLLKVFPKKDSEEMKNSLNLSEKDNSTDILNVSENNNSQEEIVEQDLITKQIKDAAVKILCAGIAMGVLTLFGLKVFSLRKNSLVMQKEVGSAMASDVINVGTTLLVGDSEEVPRMDTKFAEGLVRKWQNIKTLALGPEHYVGKLSEALDGHMLKIWSDRATEIAQHGWFWEYNLLNLNIDSVTVSVDNRRAIVEATLEESATLTDMANHEHDDTYTTTYTTRYEMSYTQSGWKITEGAVLK